MNTSYRHRVIVHFTSPCITVGTHTFQGETILKNKEEEQKKHFVDGAELMTSHQFASAVVQNVTFSTINVSKMQCRTELEISPGC